MIEEDNITAQLIEEQASLTMIIEQLDSMTSIEFVEFGNATRLSRDITKGKIEALKWVLEIENDQ